MSIVNEIFTEKVVFSLGWTFINSLWQGGFICLVNGIILLMLSKQNARLRYFVSTGSLLTILLIALGSFFALNNYYDTNMASSGLASGIANSSSSNQGIYGLFFLKFIPFSSSDYLIYFNNNLPLILTIWFWSVLFLSLKQLGGFALTQRLVHYKTSIPAIEWQVKVNYLSGILKLNKTVKLFESAIVKVPTAIGFIKPVILIPLGLILAIPEKQIETILLHELAHIKRKDFLINILQNILEVVFFFNPFVWLISSIVRSEREHCCDDMVVSVSGDTISYIKALANISAMDSFKSGYAMALSLNQNQLLKRIDRIIKMKNYKSSYSRLLISTIVLLLGITFLSTYAMEGFRNQQDKQPVAQQSKPIQDAKISSGSSYEIAPQAQNASEGKMKKEQLIAELKKKYESATDEETKKKIKGKIQFIMQNNIEVSQSDNSKMEKREQAIIELKKKYESTTDEELKKKIEQKLKAIKEEAAFDNHSKDFELQKKEQMIMDLKKKYESTTDEELKKKIEQKLKTIKEDPSFSYTSKDFELQKKEQMIMDLKKKYESTTDEELKKKIEQKLKSIKEDPSFSYTSKDLDLKKEQMIMDLKKKYESTTDEELKKKIEEKIKSLKEK